MPHNYDKILHGDCLDVLKTYPKNSVNLIFTSPPYADQRKQTLYRVRPYETVGVPSNRG